ncbi:dienelactone hydrolase family protein [Mucilaginibacter roseus]|uniref:Dienelactone hydrolase family protein n=1 Tax=Mucilaginibacter roseus TaxID=1528868 RepID=A0ABS8TYG7_9SPHI|nr:dienelactone hydrolase family protein [Mucilaginibacter roseus]MCD8739918.1 dienelactone hydrolase family protein [Mucilaginibacter roseus]
MYTHHKQYITAGKPIAQAGGALIMIHGRGGSAENIISLAGELNTDNLAIYGPQASNHSWYPYSFMAADDLNQPALNSAIGVIGELVDEILSKGIPAEKIYFAGFSQGACLTLEYIALNAKKYGGAVAFTGGLIGQQFDASKYNGDFNGTPVLITTGDPDPHVPLTRVEESVELLKKLNADVNVTVFKGRPHTIIQQEIDLANKYVFH